MELLHICILASFVIGAVGFYAPRLMGYESENAGVGCLAFAILLPLCGIINWFGSDDPNSFFVRKQLIIVTEAEIRESGTENYSKGVVVGKGNFFNDDDLLCLEFQFTDENGKDHYLHYLNDYLTFGKTTRISDSEDYNKQYFIRLPAGKSNLLLSKYNKKKMPNKEEKLAKLMDEYEEKYESYIFKEEYDYDDSGW